MSLQQTEARSKGLIELSNISKAFDGKAILKDINFSVDKNQFLTILGPSGCGKTTLLRMIGGFEEPDSGTIFLNGKCINGVSPHDRNINTVFQKYSLFPHMNVFDNIAFGLKLKKQSAKTISKKVKDALKLVSLSGFEKRSIEALSGGEQQRVAIARALVMHPEVLLLDEPLSALDRRLRLDMQRELKEIQMKAGITFIYVTHDQEEALTMSDKVIVLNEGATQQIDTPDNIYNEPVNLFVADFVGTNNIIDGRFIDDHRVSFLGAEFECDDVGFVKSSHVHVIIRPEDFILGEGGKLAGHIRSAAFKGMVNELVVLVEETELIVRTTTHYVAGTDVFLDVIPFNIHVLPEEQADEKV